MDEEFAEGAHHIFKKSQFTLSNQDKIIAGQNANVGPGKGCERNVNQVAKDPQKS